MYYYTTIHDHINEAISVVLVSELSAAKDSAVEKKAQEVLRE